MKSKTKLQLKDILDCSYCDKHFKYLSERKRHEQSHVPQFACNVCQKKFSFLSALRRHEKQHKRTGSVVCNKCNRNFRDEILLKRHIKYAHKGSFSCSKCQSLFSSEMALNIHMKTHKPESERRFRCSILGCNKSFNFSHHLKHHELTHTNEKQYYCKECGKGFIQAHHLKSHLKKHAPQAWILCTEDGCSQRFTNEYARKKHVARHKVAEKRCLSSDPESFGDVPDNTVEVPESCEQLIKKEEHESCTNNIIETKDVYPIVSQVKSIEEDLPLAPIKDISEEDKNCLRSCKTVLGGCIMSGNGEINENCLCIQMSSDLDEDYKTSIKMETSKQKSKVPNSDKKGTHMVQGPPKIEKNNSCRNCECSKNLDTSLKLTTELLTEDVRPEFEYRSDGTVKIKNTFSIDIDVNFKSEKQREDKVIFPFNSCKTVLGKCIASENGVIDEGCLCAKMSFDDDSTNAEEIDELTPLSTRISLER